MTFFPGTVGIDSRFVDQDGNVAVLLQLETRITLEHRMELWVWGKCLTRGKIFALTLLDWNAEYTSIDSKAYKQRTTKSTNE